MNALVIGLAWPEEHATLRFMAEVLELGMRIHALRDDTPAPVAQDA